jgi:hypothetical protein
MPEAREIIAARFRNAVAPVQRGIAPSLRRRQRPDAPQLPLLSVDDATRLARSYFRREMIQLDIMPQFARSLDEEDAARHRQELAYRIGELALLAYDEDAEHPALAVEISLLHEAGFRSPFDSRPSLLFREYLRRAMLQISTIEQARFEGDFSDEVRDALFQASFGLPAEVSSLTHEAANPGVTIGHAAERFLAELLQRSRAEKTQDRYRREVAHIVAFLDPTAAMGSVRRQQCVDLRDTFALLPPNFGKPLAEGGTIRELAARRSASDPTLQWETHEKYLAMLS